MSEERRGLVIYEQTDGSFRIPPEVARQMGPGLVPYQITEDASISIPLIKKQDPKDDVAFLRYENQLYKKRYLQCMRQFGELMELNQLISTKLDLAIHCSDGGLDIRLTALIPPTRAGVRVPQFMQMEPRQGSLNEMASTSTRGSKGTNLENMKLIPPKKRHRE